MFGSYWTFPLLWLPGLFRLGAGPSFWACSVRLVGRFSNLAGRGMDLGIRKTCLGGLVEFVGIVLSRLPRRVGPSVGRCGLVPGRFSPARDAQWGRTGSVGARSASAGLPVEVCSDP